jgi:hypothetical protein
MVSQVHPEETVSQEDLESQEVLDKKETQVVLVLTADQENPVLREIEASLGIQVFQAQGDLRANEDIREIEGKMVFLVFLVLQVRMAYPDNKVHRNVFKKFANALLLQVKINENGNHRSFWSKGREG